MRSLRTEEESEVQSVIHSRKKPAPYTTAPAAASAEQGSRDSGYAVMTRIRVVDHWTWATWMCFETSAQAVAHARKGDKVVRFASEEWAALKQQKWETQPPQSDAVSLIRVNVARESLPSRVEGELLIEVVLRLLNALDPAGLLPIEGQEDDRLTSGPDKQTSNIETPTFVARLILSRLNESEIRKLEILSGTDLLTFLNVLRNRSHAIVKSKSRYQ